MKDVKHRLFGLILSLAGVALFVYLARDFHTSSPQWITIGEAVDWPGVLLLAFSGAGLVTGGAWLMLHPNRQDPRA